MTRQVYNPIPPVSERDDKPTSPDVPRPGATSRDAPREVALRSREEEDDFRELLRCLACPSEEDSEDDTSEAMALGLEDYLALGDDLDEEA